MLRGCDQVNNLVLEDSHERIYSETEGVDKLELGLYIVRGPNVYVTCACQMAVSAFACGVCLLCPGSILISPISRSALSTVSVVVVVMMMMIQLRGGRA